MFMNKKSQYFGWQFFPAWSIHSIKSQSKSNQAILWISTNWFQSLYGKAEDPEKPTQYCGRRKLVNLHYLTSRLL